MKKNKIIAVAAFAILTLLLIPINTFAADDSLIPKPPAIDTENVNAAYFYCITTDTLLVSHNAGERLPASTSAKIMAGLIFCEQLSDRLDETVTVNGEITSAASGRSLKLADGEIITVRDLLYAAICGTYNDAAYVLAHLVGGSVDSFVTMMNMRAAELGATNTNYVNPIGYPDHENMISTAVDISKIALCAYENPLYMEISSAYTYNLNATNVHAAKTIYNSNHLLSSNDSTVNNYFDSRFSGMNSGNTGTESGWTLVTVGDDDGAKYLFIVLGAKDEKNGTVYSYRSVADMMNWASANYGFVKVFDKGHELGMTSIKNTAMSVDNAAYLTADELSVYIPQGVDLGDKLQYFIALDEEKLIAPVNAGTVVGQVKIVLEGHTIGSCDLVLRDSYESNAIVQFMNNFSSYFSSRPFFLAIALFVLGTPITLLCIRLIEVGAFKNKTFRIFKK